ncbi:MAG: tetratricopeptide repeat protein [Geothrix sp.]|nr:tetratricopeptide repeat protein [Geothrix sp.]
MLVPGRKRILALLFLGVSFLQAQGGQPSADAMRAALPALKGKERLATLLDLANALETKAPREALAHASEGRALAIQLGDKEKETACLTTAAYCCIQTGDFTPAIEQGKQALALADAIGNRDRAGKAHNILGAAYTFMGAYSQALEEGIQALRIREALGQENSIALSLNLLGVIYHQSGQYEKAIEYYDHILRRLQEHPDTRRLILAKLNKGFAQYKLGRLAESLRNHQEALALAEASGESAYLNYTHLNLGLTYTDLKQFDQARHYLHLADLAYREQDQKHGLVQVLNARARLHLLSGEFAKGIPLAREGAALARSINARDELKKSYEMISDLYGRLNNLPESYRYYKLATQTKDSIYTIQESNKIAEASMRIVTLKKDGEIEALKKEQIISGLQIEKQRYLSIIFVSSIGFLGAIVFLLGNYGKQMRQAKKRLEQSNADLASINTELQDKINEVKTLSGLLPICAQCKKIRDDEGYWTQLEGYISERTSAIFTHGICPHCAEALYPDAMKQMTAKGEKPAADLG